MNNTKKILFPYILSGLGHIIAARSIAYYLNQKKPNWTLRFLEIVDEFEDGRLNIYYKRSWTTVLKHQKWAKIFFFLLGEVLAPVTQFLNKGIIYTAVPKAIGFLLGFQPDLILATHWGCTHVFNAARKKGGYDTPLLYVRNDLGGGLYLQNCGADLYFAMTEEAKQGFLEIGIPEKKVVKVNPLVKPDCTTDKIAKKDARKKLIIPAAAFTILLSAGGEGLGFGSIIDLADGFVRLVKEKEIEARLIIVTGRNKELLAKLKSSFPIPEIVPLGYRDDMHVLTIASDIVGGKCGAIYTMETIMLYKPFIITQVGAPTELHNKEFIVKNNYGWYAPTTDDFISVLEDILNDSKIIEDKINNLSKLSSKNGAEEIAETIINILEK